MAICALTEAVSYNSAWYSKDELGTAEAMAYASGNGKINYYYTKRQKKNEGWTYAGTGWLDRKTAVTKNQLATFQSGWSYNNDGNDTNDSGKATGQGVWRVKEISADGTEGGWLDETDEYKNRFLLKVKGDIATHPPEYVYGTAAEVMAQVDGYTKISGTDYWKKNDATPYMEITANGKTYYLPQNGITLYDGNDPAPSADNKISIKYYDNGTEKDGYADISDAKKYYKIYQDDIEGNDTTDNPMFVDELGNVQYRHKKDANGNEIEKNDDGSVAYETIEPTIDPHDDPALLNRAIETAVKEMIANLPEDETAELDTRDKQIAYLKETDSETYDAKVNKYFHDYFNYLEDDNVKFFNKDYFHLATSVFDNFQLVKMTQYSYLNERETETADKRSINNFFTNADAIRTD